MLKVALNTIKQTKLIWMIVKNFYPPKTTNLISCSLRQQKKLSQVRFINPKRWERSCMFMYVYKIYNICLKSILSGGRMWQFHNCLMQENYFKWDRMWRFHNCLMQENSLFWSAWNPKNKESKRCKPLNKVNILCYYDNIFVIFIICNQYILPC